jgi:sulfoxide reductase heme-binding subunit YedZ
MKPWHLRHLRTLIYSAAFVAGVVIFAVSAWDAGSFAQAMVAARQLFGLWALALLLVSMSAGPLTSVLPWLPLKIHLMYGRRAIGVSAFALAVAHVLCYVAPVAVRNWREFFAPGVLWIAGLMLSSIAFVDMAVLALTSRDAAVKRLGGRRWKQWHRTVYALLAIVLVHAILNGSDFGLNRAPDVRGPLDAGSLIGFAIAAAAWFVLFVLRRRGVRWPMPARRAANPG